MTDPSPIFTNSRQTQILELIRLHGTCSIPEMSKHLGVSAETIRRDVKPLVENSLALKVHGGIMLPEHLQEPPFQRRLISSKEEKQKIAALTADIIHNGESLLMDAGTTNIYVAQALLGHRNLKIITNSPEIARILSTRNDNRVYLAGGEVHAELGATLGPIAHDFIRQFHVNYALLSVSAINDIGFMDIHSLEADFSKQAIFQAKQVIVVADKSKYGREGFCLACDFSDADLLICDELPPNSLAKKMSGAGIEVITPHSNNPHTTSTN